MTLPTKLTEATPASVAIDYPEVIYPESDGQLIGETDIHIAAILYLRQALRHIFRQAEQIYVAANMLFYYEKGDPTAVRAPDVFVVKGIAKHDRRIYKLWQEQVAPCAVFEITSRSTRLEDLGTKRALYEMLGVQEYFLFDPLDEYLSPRLQGFTLVEGYCQPLTLTSDKTLFSQTLDLILRPEGSLLRVINPSTSQTIPTLTEAMDVSQAEAERANAAEAEAARLRAELARLRGRPENDSGEED
jgi:Uma2 family endonuclease